MASTPLPLIPWSRTGLSTKRNSIDSMIPVHHAAVDLFILGYPKLANKLIDTLYEHGHGIEFDDMGSGKYAMIALYDAWEATDTMPSYIKNPDPNKIFNGRDAVDENSRKRWKAIKESVEKEAKRFEEDVMKKDAVAVYRQVQEQWEKSDEDDLRKWLGKELPLHHAPEIWQNLKEAEVGKALDVDEDALEAFVTEGCDLIKQRFTTGPTRSYANHSMPSLLEILNESHKFMDMDEAPDSFLRPPVTSAAITALITRLSTSASPDDDSDSENAMLPDARLPPDYKEFLQTSNGFEDEPGSQTGLFCCIEEVGNGDVTWLHDLEYTLFPYPNLPSLSDIDQIPLGEWSGFHIGAGGDEGNVVLIPSTYVKSILEAFERAYEVAGERDKRAYERAAVDLYGGLEKLRGLEWLCLACFHWDPEENVYAGFREYLEYCVEEAVRKRGEVERRREEKEEEEEERKEMVERKRKKEGEEGRERKSQRTE